MKHRIYTLLLIISAFCIVSATTVCAKESETVTSAKTVTATKYRKASLKLLSSLIFCEAGAEKYAGQKAVGIVVMNRMRSSLFPNTLSGVIRQTGQFTPAHNGFLSKALKKYNKGRIPQSCITAAKAALNGDTTVRVRGKDVDIQNYLFFSGHLKGRKLRIGGHHFK